MSSPGPRHAAIRGTESGCLAIADISGYTSYLGSAELDHAQDVLEDLTETVVRALSPPMTLSKLEGDAVFVYVPGNRVDASMLLDTLDAAYFAFRRRQDAIDRATQCDCNACALIPRLDLKFVAHHGAFGRQHVAGGEDLSGPDVILVHRLLKNHVAEAIGHAGYALYTDAVVAAMGVAPDRLRMRRHAEEVEGIGPTDGWIQDLHERWAEERERRRVKVSREEAVDVSSYEVPGPRAAAWNHLTDPGLRAAWMPGVKRIDQSTPDGRRGVGTQNHCVHGKNASLEEILDWRPFDYFTILNHVPMPLLKPMRQTYELEDVPGGTRVTEYIAPGEGLGQRTLLAVVGRMLAGALARRGRGGESGRAGGERDRRRNSRGPTSGLTPGTGRASLRPMASRVKRTYNLDPRTVRRVREMAERYGVAPSQDAVVELAVDELERRLREAREADAWEAAASDPGFATEVSAVEGAYRSADRETWPA